MKDTPPLHEPSPPPSPEDLRKAHRASLIIMSVMAVFLLLAGAGVWMAMRSGAAAISKTKEIAVDIARSFKSGTITETFLQHNVEVSSTRGDVLEVAILKNDEIFRRTQSRRAAWDLIPLGTTVSEIRVPVTYRYHIKLSEPWQLDAKGQTCIVIAPLIRPSLPPALHVDQMEKHSESGWALFDKKENLEKLETGLMAAVTQRAEINVKLAREQCRHGVAEFVKNWLLREDHWREDRFSSILVVFPDELEPGSDAASVSEQTESRVNTLRLK